MYFADGTGYPLYFCSSFKKHDYGGCTTISELMINEQIRDREVRLIGENGEQLGIMSARDAFKLAQEAELDLVKIAPTAKPPVCKIIDYENTVTSWLVRKKRSPQETESN